MRLWDGSSGTQRYSRPSNVQQKSRPACGFGTGRSGRSTHPRPCNDCDDDDNIDDGDNSDDDGYPRIRLLSDFAGIDVPGYALRHLGALGPH